MIVQMMAKLERGGAQKILVLLAGIFPDSMIISGEGGDMFPEVQKEFGSRHVVIPELLREIRPLKDLVAFLKLRSLFKKLINKYGFIILHTHGSKAGILGPIASAGLKGIKVIHTSHGFAIHPYNPPLVNLFYLLAERLASKFRDIMVFPCRTSMEKARDWRIGNPCKYRVVLNGVSMPEKITKKKRGLITIGTVANFKPQKNPFLWAEVVKKVLEKESVRFIYCGGGPHYQKVKEMFSGEERVILTGWVKNPCQYLKQFDIFFLPSRWEGLPLSLLDAMAYGIPPVVSNVDGNAEVVEDGINGFLCNPDDIDCFVQKLKTLINNRTLREKMGKEARKTVENNYSIEGMLDGYRNIYKEMVL